MSLSGMSMWEECLSAKKAEEEAKIKQKRDNELQERGGYYYYVVKNELEEDLTELNRRYAIEHAMRAAFKSYDEEFKNPSPGSYLLGNHTIQIHDTYIFGGTCSMEEDRWINNRISFKEYSSLQENRAVYNELIAGGHIVLGHPTLEELFALDHDIRAGFHVQTILNPLRPYIKEEVMVECCSSDRGSYEVKRTGFDVFNDIVRIHLNSCTRRAREACFGEMNFDKNSWTSLSAEQLELSLKQLISAYKSVILEIKAYFQISNKELCKAYGKYLNIPENNLEEIPEKTHVLRSGKRY
jgi:hypothetical protein